MSGTYYTTVYLTNYGTQNPFTVTSSGVVSVSSGDGIVGATGYAWTVFNHGTVASSGGGGTGIYLGSGGWVGNGQSGSAAGLISGSTDGVHIAGKIGTVSNFGSIGGGQSGIVLGAGGTVVNSGVVTGGSRGIRVSGVGVVSNSGSIGGDVYLGGGGTIGNSGTITGAAFVRFSSVGIVNNSGVITQGVDLFFGSGTLNNTGTVLGGVSGLAGFGAVVVNNSAKISGAVSLGTSVNSGTLVNSGVILGGPISVFLVNNTAAGNIGGGVIGYSIANSGTITGGVRLTDAAGNVVNHGAISGGLTFGNSGTATAQRVTNYGTISGAVSFAAGPDLLVLEPGSVLGGSLNGFGIRDTVDLAQTKATGAVFSNGTLSVMNGATTAATLLVSGPFSPNSFAVSSDGSGGVDVNLGKPSVIDTTYSFTVYLTDYGVQNPFTVTSSGVVSVAGGDGIVGATGYAWTVFNQGTVASSGGGGTGIYLGSGGWVGNGQSGSTAGLISGSTDGVHIAGKIGTVSNFGSIGGGQSGIVLGAGGTVVNSGVVTGGSRGIRVSGVGVVSNSGSIGGDVYLGGGGTIGNSGTITGAAYVRNGSVDIVNNSGVITQGVDLFFGSGTLNNTGTVLGGVSGLAGFGAVVVNNSAKISGAVSLGTSVNSGTLVNSGVILGGPISVFLVNNTAAGNIGGGVIGYSIANSGTITGGVRLTDAAGNVVNHGAISGGLTFGNSGTATAQRVTNYGTISGAVSFAAGPDLLVLEPGSVLGGSLNGFGIRDTVDLAQTQATGAVFSNGTLSVMNGATTAATLLVSGPFSPNSFAVSSDGSGGVDVNLGKPSVIDTTYSFTVYLTDYGVQNPFTVTSSGVVSVAGGDGIVGATGYAWTVFNQGTVASSGGGGTGIYLGSGGWVGNGQSGSTAGLISGSTDGVHIAGKIGTVSNFGSIGGGQSGIVLGAGGTVVNSGVVTGGSRGIRVSGAGVVSNSGSIGGDVYLGGGGTIGNSGTITGAAYVRNGNVDIVNNSGVITQGVDLFFGSGTLNNTGTVLGGVSGLAGFGAVVVNNSAKISGAVSLGTSVNSGTLVNSGVILGGPISVFLVNNTAAGNIGGGVIGYSIANSGTITGGVRLTDAAGNVVNHGAISGGLTFGNSGTATAQRVTNYGTISGAVQFAAGPDLLVLEPGSVLGGSLNGFGIRDTVDLAQTQATGAVFSNGTLSVMNGTATAATLLVSGPFNPNSFAVSSDGSGGVDVSLSGPLGHVLGGTYGYTIVLTSPNANTTILSSGLITAPSGPGVVNAVGVVGTLTNLGTITATGSSGAGVNLSGGGLVANGTAGFSGGYIAGAAAGVSIDGGIGTVTNSGTIKGASGVVIANSSLATVANAGTIAGTSGTAVSLGGGNNRLIVAPGALFQGTVDGGGGQSVVEVAATPGGLGGAMADGSATTVYVNLGSIINFSALQVDVSAAIDVGGPLSFDTLVNQGRINLLSGDSLSVGTVASAVGAGTIDVKGGGTVHFMGQVAADQTVLFRPPGGSVIIDHPEQFAAAMTEFADGDIIDLPLGQASFQQYSGGVLSLSYGGLSVELLLSTSYTTPQFLFTGDGAGGTDILVSAATCFCRGTLIRTERGEVAVEDLAVGERVVTVSGALKPIVWIGCGRDLVTRANKLARPVIVRRGALTDDVPTRDLYLTHGHALYLDGVLIPVENLVNHRSILWDESARVVEYFHIELAEHDVVLANGAPAESYYDAGNRALFHNTRLRSAPGTVKPSFAPVLNGGEVVEQAWMKLYERAGGRIASETTADPDPHLLVDRTRHDPVAVEDGTYSFALASPPAEPLRLRSRSGVPSLLGVSGHDHRRLGIAIRRIVVSQPGVATAIEHDASLFVLGGCHPAEHGYCWTDGELTLPPHLFAHLTGAFTLAVHTERPGMRYPLPSAVGVACLGSYQRTKTPVVSAWNAARSSAAK